MLKIKSWKVFLDWEDITDKPVFNYVWLSRYWSVLLRPSKYEDRAEWTFIMPEVDDDRVYYLVFWKWKQVAYTHTRKNAEKALELAEQMQYEIENCKEDEFALDEYLENDEVSLTK